MDHDAAVGQHVASVSCDEQQRRHTGRRADAHGVHRAGDGAHDVVERKPRLHLAAGAVDKQHDGCLRVAFLQVKQAARGAGDRARVDGAGQLDLAVGQHLVAHVEALDAFAGFMQDEWGIGGNAHVRSFRGRRLPKTA